MTGVYGCTALIAFNTTGPDIGYVDQSLFHSQPNRDVQLS